MTPEDARRINEELLIEVMKLFASKGMTVDLMYWAVGSIFLRLAQSLGIQVHQLLGDVEIAFKSLPPPIEDPDESNEQPNIS